MAKAHKLPFDELTVMGMKYSVRLVDKIVDEHGNPCWGDTDSEIYEIRLADGPRKRVNRTLCHELVHVWQDALGIEVSEEQAQKFEGALFDMMMNQHKMVEFLQKTSW